MNENIIPVNNEALSRALVEVAGEETAALIVRAYKAIDAAMAHGFKQGAKQAADEYAKKDTDAYKAAFNAGFDAGLAEAKDEPLDDPDTQDAYDDGYIDGVADARRDPAEADDYIAYLCALDAHHDFDDLEPKINAQVEGFDFDPSDYTPVQYDELDY